MSYPALVVVKDVTGIRHYTHRSASRTLSWDAALAGQGETLARVRGTMTDEGPGRESLWCYDWADGCLLIDKTTQRLLWCNSDSEPGPPRIANYVLERTWPGWTASWLPEGPHGIAGMLGIELSGVQFDVGRRLDVPLDFEQLNGALPDPAPCDPTAISIQLGDELIVWRSEVDLDAIALCTPESVISFARHALDHERAGDGWGSHMNLDTADEDGQAATGVHIDATHKTVHWWSFVSLDLHKLEFARHWPDYRIYPLGDDYEWQERAIGGFPLRPAWNEQLHTARRDLAELVTQGSDGWGFQNVGMSFDALSALADDSRPLRPATFVDDAGSLHESTLSSESSAPSIATPAWAQPRKRRGSTMQAMFDAQVAKNKEREIRGDTDYDSPHKDSWHLDVQGGVSARGALLRDILRAVGFAGHAMETTNSMVPGQCAFTIELTTGHWIELRCDFNDGVANGTADEGTFANLSHITTVMTDPPDSPYGDREHRVERHFESADDDPPLPPGYQFQGGRLMTAGTFGSSPAARPLRTIVRALWETCFHADVIETFFHWFMGLSVFEVNLSGADTDVVDGQRQFILEFEYERWAGACVTVSVPLRGGSLGVLISDEVPIDLAQDVNAVLRDLCPLLGMELPTGEDPAGWILLQFQEIAYDCYGGRIQQAAFAPEAR